ncbi:DUF1929-domain-containing protein [Serendipita vermifera]|nr:DUF1929-domain-containing protein [Serendipita vermifera]
MSSHSSSSRLLSVLSIATANALVAVAQQPTRQAPANSFEIVGNSKVSAQQVYILDKVENNPIQVNGHPAWAVEYDLETNQIRAMDVVSNSFCAGGGVLGDGTWVNVGGNQAVKWGGDKADTQDGTSAPYHNVDGGKSIRTLVPCDDQNCNWVDDPANYMVERRWYPTLENLPDGSLFLVGGNKWGGFVNLNADDNNPTYEFFPKRGDPIGLNILTTTLPANLYPFTFLLPSGNLFIQTNWGAAVYDYINLQEYPYPNVPHAVRTYPASAGNMMLPLTPDNNYQATMIFCGGTDLEPDQWRQDWDIASYPADASCVKITPDAGQQWEDDDTIGQGRTMGNMIGLPDLTVLLINGANTGTAGYGNESWARGTHSYADNPIRTPLIYDPAAPRGSRWTSANLPESTVNRMYHSGALLLPDGSVFVAGSNPNPDYIVGENVQYPWEDRTERFYPWYYDKRRPEPQGVPTTLSYGGDYFDVKLTKQDLEDNSANIKNTKAVVIRTGFSTHAFNMGQRVLQLRSSYTVADDGSATLHVSQLPGNANVFPPGPALLYITVNGVPSIAQWIRVGSGVIETQPINPDSQLPDNFIPSQLDGEPTNNRNVGFQGKALAGGLVSLLAMSSIMLLL